MDKLTKLLIQVGTKQLEMSKNITLICEHLGITPAREQKPEALRVTKPEDLETPGLDDSVKAAVIAKSREQGKSDEDIIALLNTLCGK